MNRNGFTLIEIIVSLSILAVIMLAGIAAFSGVLDGAAKRDCDNKKAVIMSIYNSEKEFDPHITLDDILDYSSGVYIDQSYTCGGKEYTAKADGADAVVCPRHK